MLLYLLDANIAGYFSPHYIYIWTALLDTLQTGIITTKYKLHQLLNYGVLL